MAVESSVTGSGVFGTAAQVGPAVAAPRPVRLGEARVSAVGRARVYVCGITPYDVTHLGHAATFVWADVLGSVFDAVGAHADVCRNVTDVDDVLLRAAQSRGRYYDEFALSQEFLFTRSMDALRVATPAHEPRARHHIAAVQQLAQALLDAGHAYERDGWVRFRGAEVPQGAGLARDEAVELSRGYGDDPDDPAKDDPFDVTLWQPSTGQDPAWPSPWGWGRPGWHAECAAMAMTVHGASLDVLVGGDDLVFPHHAYQAAMVEAASGGGPFARARLHVGSVRLDGERMAKSTGNLVLVDDVLARCSPAALRLLLIDRHYSDSWDFDQDGVDAASARLERLYAVAAARAAGSGQDLELHDRLLSTLSEDLDVPGALDLAEEAGGSVARQLIKVLRLG
ncbi:MAG: cysteine--tRNA ligase [Nocardioidaceae bacterium]